MKKIKCPICEKYQPIINPDVRKHIIQIARHEVWRKAIEGKGKTPHFDFYLKNTKPVVYFEIPKRTWRINQ